jgi:hypothetical protein
MDVVSRLGHFVWRMIRLNIASLDPLRRRRVRAAAMRLVPAKAWAASDATADEIARVALLRVLFLQRDTRRAASHGEGEATALLARASMEAAISGLFCIHVPGAEKLFEGEMAKRANKLLRGVSEGADMAGAFDEAFAQIGSGKLPTVAGMVEQIEANGGGAGVGSLHANFYDQVSSLYVHGGPLGLIRHVHPKTGKTRERPYSVWSRRSAKHMSDAMVGLLAAAIAGNDHPDSELFREYEAAHFGVTWTPLAFVARGLMATRVSYRYVPDMIRLVQRLAIKTGAGESLSEADADEVIVKMNLIAGLDPDDQTYASFANVIRARLVGNRPESADSPTEPAA